MFKHVVIAGLLTFGSVAAYAQTQQATSPPKAGDAGIVSQPTGADANKLIGRNIKNAQDETIGEVDSVYIDKDGKVDSVIVGVGGFLGMGEREVKAACLEGPEDQSGR